MKQSIYPALLPFLLPALLLAAVVRAQSVPALPDAPTPALSEPTVRSIPRDLLQQQAALWTSPLHASDRAMIDGVLFLAAAGVIGSEDRNLMQHHFLDPNTNRHANTASTGLTGLLAAAPFAYYGLGHFQHSAQTEQTGILAGEAVADSLILNEALKVTARRERPTVDNAQGKFFQPGIGFNSSFASDHSALAWSSATVIASESQSRWLKLTAYGLATGVSVSRVVGRDHFPSDVFVGSALGWAVGRYVHHRHHPHPHLP